MYLYTVYFHLMLQLLRIFASFHCFWEEGMGAQWRVFQQSGMQVRFKFSESHFMWPHSDESGRQTAARNSSSSVVWQRERGHNIFHEDSRMATVYRQPQCWEWHRHIRVVLSRARFNLPSVQSNILLFAEKNNMFINIASQFCLDYKIIYWIKLGKQK